MSKESGSARSVWSQLWLAGWGWVLSCWMPGSGQWDAYVARFDSPFWCFFLNSFGIHVGVFVGLNIILALVENCTSWLESYRLQPRKETKSSGANSEASIGEPPLSKCFRVIGFNLLVLQPLLLATGWPLYQMIGIDVVGLPPAPWEVLVALAVCVVCEDTAFYWTHRMLHSKQLYSKVHKLHHEFRAPRGYAAEYAHPIEFLLSNAFPFAIGPLALAVATGRCHLLTSLSWTIFRVTESVDGHCGYDLPFSPYRALPFRPSALEHDWHHSRNAGNFGSFFTFWDDLCGTSRLCVQSRLKAKSQ